MRPSFVTIALIALTAFTGTLAGQDKGADTYNDKYSKKIIYHLTDEKFQGRESGTEELDGVIKFITREFKKAGWEVEHQSATAQELAEEIGEPKPGKTYPSGITNIIAEIEGRCDDKYVVIGAHFDHLGNKEGLGIHPGADDNASGIAALLNLAKMIRATGQKPEYTVLLCAWDGEEKGLLGSKYFVSEWDFDDKEILYYMNFDMVGRTADPANPEIVFAWNNNFPQLLDHCKTAYAKVPAPFSVVYDERTGNGKGGSDYAPFSKRNIPFVAWMEVELHEDYHKPGDTPDKINWNKLEKGTTIAYWVIYEWIFSK